MGALVLKRHSFQIGAYFRGRCENRRKPNLWTYEVLLDDIRIGWVECFEQPVHRYGGTGRKHITRTFYPLEWRWWLDGHPFGRNYRRRKDAVEDLRQAYDEASR